MANGTVTRTVFYAKAYAWQIRGINEDGSPDLVKVGGIEFISTKPTKKEAFQALKLEGFKVKSDMCTFEVDREECIAQALDTFIEHGTVVERGVNGRVKQPSEE